MKVLIVVDMQKDFIDGALGSPEAQAIVDNVAAKVKEYEGDDSLVIYTKDTHFDNYLETQEGRNLPVPHCIKGTDGWTIDPRVYNGGLIVEKKTFGSSELPHQIAKETFSEKIDSIELVGLCTDICVISNAMLLKAFFPEEKIIVDSKCCAGVSPESHQIALNAMKMCQIEVI